MRLPGRVRLPGARRSATWGQWIFLSLRRFMDTDTVSFLGCLRKNMGNALWASLNCMKLKRGIEERLSASYQWPLHMPCIMQLAGTALAVSLVAWPVVTFGTGFAFELAVGSVIAFFFVLALWFVLPWSISVWGDFVTVRWAAGISRRYRLRDVRLVSADTSMPVGVRLRGRGPVSGVIFWFPEMEGGERVAAFLGESAKG